MSGDDCEYDRDVLGCLQQRSHSCTADGEDYIRGERDQLENRQLKDELRHLQSALEIAGRILQPYFYRPTVGTHDEPKTGRLTH